MIEVKNLSKKYGDKQAVKNISFKVEQGEILGFLGPNGAGKSTTMNMLTGYISSTSGQILVNGVDIFEDPKKAKSFIGYLPEIPPLYVDMTIDAYLNFVYDLKKCKLPRKAHLKDVCDLCKITDVKNRIIKNLSKGYRQRVGIAQAVLGYPEVIILDEPTVGLDPKQINEIRDLIKGLKKKHTVILSSHILSEVSAVCDYVLIISHGKLVASDTPENLGKLAAGANSLSLLVKGPKDTVRAALEAVEGVKEVTAKKSPEEGVCAVSVATEENTDVREKVFNSMVNAGCPILEMQSKKVSLEEIFLELTENEKNENTVQYNGFLNENIEKTDEANETMSNNGLEDKNIEKGEE